MVDLEEMKEVEKEEEEGHNRLLASLGVGGEKAERRATRMEPVDAAGLLASATAALGSTTKLQHLLQTARKRAPTLGPRLHGAAAGRLERGTAYAGVKKELGKWDAVVRANREAEHQNFPLYEERPRLRSVAQAREEGLTPRTRLEKEMAAALATSKHVLPKGAELTEAEKELCRAMSAAEAERRSAEVSRLRSLQSQQEAKWRRAKKIKSKAYHRLKKRAERRRLLQELEELRERDPEAARQRLEVLERDRILERGTLSHRGTGQWAKTLRLHARHDPKTKELLQAQLRYGRELAEKRGEGGDDSSDEEKEGAEGKSNSDPLQRLQELASEAAAEAEAPVEGLFRGKDNPWLRSALGRIRAEEAAANAAPEMREASPMVKDEEEEDSRSPSPETPLMPDQTTELLVEKPVKTKKEKSAKKKKRKTLDAAESMVQTPKEEEEETKSRKRAKKRKSRALEEAESVNASEIDAIFEGMEARLVASAKASLDERLSEEEGGEETPGLQSLASKVAKARKAKRAAKAAKKKKAKEETSAKSEPVKEALADPQEYLKLGAAVEGAEADAEAAMAEAFADDDVVAEFAAAKERVEEAERPKDLCLALPGWGDWAGPDLKVSKAKRRRFTVKAKAKGPRKDAQLPGVIIAERDEEAARELQVKSLPFPWTCVEDWEAAQKHPLGREWNTRLQHAKLTQPSVSTKRGRLIKPMDRDATFEHLNEDPDSDAELK